MNNYYEKYIKYKNKYIALQATYLNIINENQKINDFDNTINKNKFYLLQSELQGGASPYSRPGTDKTDETKKPKLTLAQRRAAKFTNSLKFDIGLPGPASPASIANSMKIELEFLSRSNVSLIIPNLYLGNLTNAKNCENLKDEYNIKAILNMTPFNYDVCPYIEYIQIPLLDLAHVDIAAIFNDAFDFIDAKLIEGKPIYVHCQEGISRSATIVIMYLMRKYNCSYQSTYDYVKSKRLCVDPNIGFVSQLHELEKQLILVHGALNTFPIMLEPV